MAGLARRGALGCGVNLVWLVAYVDGVCYQDNAEWGSMVVPASLINSKSSVQIWPPLFN